MKKVYPFLSLLLILGCIFPASAQNKMEFAVGGQFSSPTGQLKAADYRQGGGIWMEFLSPEIPTQMPVGLQLGMQIDFSGNGMYEEQIEVQYPRPALGNLEISNNSMGLTAIARLISPKAPVRLYLDGRLGSRLMMSDEMLMVEDHDAFDASSCEITPITKTWTFAYGASTGMLIRLSPKMKLDLRATYTQGGAASFVDLNSVRLQEKANMTYNLNHASSTGMWLFQMGINMTMGCTMRSHCCSASRDEIPSRYTQKRGITPHSY